MVQIDRENTVEYREKCFCGVLVIILMFLPNLRKNCYIMHYREGAVS